MVFLQIYTFPYRAYPLRLQQYHSNKGNTHDIITIPKAYAGTQGLLILRQGHEVLTVFNNLKYLQVISVICSFTRINSRDHFSLHKLTYLVSTTYPRNSAHVTYFTCPHPGGLLYCFGHT